MILGNRNDNYLYRFVSASNILLSSKQYTKQVQDQKQCMLNGSGSEIDVKVKLTQKWY